MLLGQVTSCGVLQMHSGLASSNEKAPLPLRLSSHRDTSVKANSNTPNRRLSAQAGLKSYVLAMHGRSQSPGSGVSEVVTLQLFSPYHACHALL